MMRDFRDAKSMARALRSGLTDHGVKLTHSQSLELMAKAFGYDNWNILAAKIEAERPQPAPASEPATGQSALHCSFCGKSQYDVKKLIAGPNSFICDACVGLCTDIIEEGAVLELLAADEATAGAGHPKLDAFLAERSKAQLQFDLARLERERTRTEDGLRNFEAALEARREGRPLPGKLRPDMSDAALANQRDRLKREHDGTVKLFEIFTQALEARG